MALAVGIFSFGVIFGDLIIAGAGLGLVLFTIIASLQKRHEKSALKQKIDSPTNHGQKHITMPTPPPSQTIYLAAGVSILSAIIVWFLPGANPLWNRRRIASRKQQPNGRRRQAPKRPIHPQTAEFSQQQ
ncbi:hypothetical protein FRC0406_00715 [Corynebacterium diphtheriae]|nr:hypothetical protein FRC0026_00253 [Corynebacterium diphtheriae]CAB0789689.1 hypothetical protein FRC0201_00524 [Corynebacterium diphtheriae]CAB0878704.1 hypothetical protein FRC0406_00715 [Corynebacterium diphtheriae]CAB0954232.1 hypothetical protein FRC0482_00561 [Corynebacterium diphtheriae]CAB0985706.1 hypothetical protein FRC0507_00569 [Corynebacterium diphtheriae]